MQLDMNINLEQKQNLVMTPQLQMAIKILQYSSLELKEYIEKNIEENPLLDILEAEKAFNSRQKSFASIKKEDIEYENFIAYEPHFCEFLENQLFEILDQEDIEIGNFIVGSLNQDGELTLDPAEISVILSNSDRKISKEKVAEVYEKIKELDLHYNQRISNYNTEYITPDFIVKNEAGEFKIIANRKSYPSLSISNYYYNLLKNNEDPEINEYLMEKYKSALWLIKSIEQRQNTIEKIIGAIIEKQHDFFEKGFKFLYTMTMEELAEMIEMHESTVSRATSAKYLQTPYGVLSLKFFFNSGIDHLSSVSIKAIISEEISAEDKSLPLSDSKLADILLKKYSLNISRRTVAKYRKSIGVANSRARKS